jgi:hypothetical protein
MKKNLKQTLSNKEILILLMKRNVAYNNEHYTIAVSSSDTYSRQFISPYKYISTLYNYTLHFFEIIL